MSFNLKQEEIEVVRALQNKGLSLPEATLAVIMFTREHARPESELINIVGQYPSLEDGHQAAHTITILKDMGWLIVNEFFGQRLTQAAPNLQGQMSQKIGNPGLIERLVLLRSQLALVPYIRALGPMNENVFGTFLDLLRSAQREICLPMLVTAPYHSTADILKERAHRGVRVRILLASPKVAIKLRGGTVAVRAYEAIEGWTKIAQGIPNIEIRIAHIPEDMHFATSWTLDGRLLRFDIYDPSRQRSLGGYMIEVESPPGLELNLVTLFQERFELAWNRAQPIHTSGRTRWFLKKHWQWAAFMATALIAIVLGASLQTPVWSEIVASVSATFLFNALIASWPTIRFAIRRRLND